MDHHLGILQQHVEPRAIGRHRSGCDGERWRGDDQQKQKEDLDRRQNHGREGAQANVDAVARAHHEAVRAQKPRPQQQRALLPAPHCGKLVRRIQRNVAVGADVLHEKVVGQRRPHQGKGRAAQRNKAGDSGAAGRLAQAVPAGLGDAGRAHTTRRRAPQRKASHHKVIEGENERQQQAETSELRHGVKAHRPVIVSDIDSGK